MKINLGATSFAGWNILLLDGKNPTNKEIVYEPKENRSKRKLAIKHIVLQDFEMDEGRGFIPQGKGRKY